MIFLNKIITYIPLLILLTIGIINSYGLFFVFGTDIGGINSSYGVYELYKVLIFNVILGLFSLYSIFFINKKHFIDIIQNNIYNIFNKYLLFIIFLSLFIYIFYNGYHGFIGDNLKGHSVVMFINLLLFFIYSIYFIHYNKLLKINNTTINIDIANKNIEDKNHINDYQNKKIKYFSYVIYIIVIFGCIGIKEYLFPSFNYNSLGNRFIGTFGHPNYYAPFILVIFPYLLYILYNIYLYSFKEKFIYILSGIIILISFIFTKSIIPLGIILVYFLYFNFNYLSKKIKNGEIPKSIDFLKKNKNIIYIAGISFGCMLLYSLYSIGLITKLNSFISRLYIWETSMNIYISDIKNILFGIGIDQLYYYFNNFKSSELYLFENFGYTADKPHNFFIELLLNFGVIGLLLFICILYTLYNIKVQKDSIEYYLRHGFTLGLIFGFFNFFSITYYIFIVIIYILIIYNYNIKSTNFNENSNINCKNIKNKKNITNNKYITFIIYIFICVLLCISIIGGYLSFVKFLGHYKGIILPSYNYINNLNIKSEIDYRNELYHLYKNKLKEEKLKMFCDNFLLHYNSAENYFFCGDILNNKIYKVYYYKVGLSKIPDLWNKESIYYKKWYNSIIDERRFFHEKFGIIQKIEYIGINK